MKNRVFFGMLLLVSGFARSGALASCGSPANEIEAENCLPGNPSSEWDTTNTTGDVTIRGFATDISVNRGSLIEFKVQTNAPDYRLDIYRLGYYAGKGARKVATVTPSAALPQSQPACLTDAATQLIDCGNWAVSASWNVPSTAVSGIYFAKLVRTDTGGASHIPFIVRDDAGHADILMQASDTTWQAYNNYNGLSLYVAPSFPGRAYKVSYNRPFVTRASYSSFLFTHEYPMARFLESNGYDVSYFTGVDSDRNGALIKNHRLFISVGHDEYWSGGQRTNVEAARDAGVHLAFMSGNEVFWKTRWEPSTDGTGTPYRTLVCYKETHDGKIDPLGPTVWTGTWRDARFSPPADGGRPENALTGTSYSVDSFRNDTMKVQPADGQMRFWRNTSVAALTSSPASFPELLGYEWDGTPDNGFQPPGLLYLSSSSIAVPKLLIDDGNTYAAGTAIHHLTLYRHASGAYVFSSGSMQWPWGLDSKHDRGAGTPADVRLQQATVNLFADMRVQPASLQPGLTPASATTDSTAAASNIGSPQNGDTLTANTTVSISGTASDTGGVVAAVEVSFDNGTTWHPTVGRNTWFAAWTPKTAGTYTIKTRAVDDSGNIETPAAGVAVNVTGPSPQPTLSSLSPSNAKVGDPAFTLTLNGNNFVSGASVNWKGSPRSAVFVSATKLTVTISSSDLTTREFAAVTVSNPGSSPSSSRTFTIRLQPALTSITPTSVAAGSAAFTLTVNGSNFADDSIVQWNGADRSTVFVSTGQLKASIAVADIASSGTASVSVFNPAPGGGSAAKTFTITTSSSSNPTPTLSALSPSNVKTGNPDFVLTVTGTGFMNGIVATWNSAQRNTTFISTTMIKVDIPASDVAARGAANVSAVNPGGKPASSKTFTIRLVPSISALTPSSIAAGSSTFTLVLNGTNFGSDAIVQWKGADRSTVFVSSTQLKATIPQSDIVAVGTAAVTVFNPFPGGPSGEKIFRIVSGNGGSAGSQSVASGSALALDLEAVRVFPNPWRSDRHQGTPLMFDHLTDASTIKIFTIAGQWIRTLSESGGTAAWDMKNDGGEDTASGFYIYLITDGQNRKKRGKLALIR